MSTLQFSFEKLEVWQIARQLTGKLYKRTQSFPKEEKYSLISQIRRASISIAANIAEGSSRTSYKDQAHFSTIALGSLRELYNFLIIAFDLGMLSNEEIVEFKILIRTISIKLSNLKASQLKRHNNE